MKQGWESHKFADVFDLQMGKTPSRDNLSFWNGNNVWVSIADLNDKKYISESKEGITDDAVKESGIKVIPKDTVIMSFKLSIGKTAISTIPLFTNEAIMAFIEKDKRKLIPEYIYYYLKGYKWVGANKAVLGMTLNKKTISEQTFSYPPLPEQEKIVAELDCLSGIIEKKKQQLKEYDALAQSIFYEMFGNPIDNEKGFAIKCLGDIANSVNYGTSSPAVEGGKYTYLRMNNLTYNGYLDLTDIKSIDVPEKDLDKYIVRKGDILFNRTNSKELVGKTALFDLDKEMIIAGYIIRVRININEVIPIYVVRYMNTAFMKSYFANLCKGAVNQANINSKELKAIPIPVPPLSLQQEFASKIEAIEKQKELIKQSIAETETLFNSRMDYYFN